MRLIRWGAVVLFSLVAGSVLSESVAKTLWVPTDQTQAWSAVNEAALPKDVSVKAADGQVVPGVLFSLKNTVPNKQNGSWTFSGSAGYFDGISEAVLCMEIYVPDEALLKQDGWALSVKVGNDAGHCLIYQLFPH